MNATCFLLSGLLAGADTPPPPVAAHAPVVVSTGAGCAGCGTAAPAPAAVVYSPASTPCYPCGGQHATLVDWMKAKAAEPSKPGIIARMRAKAKPAPAHAVVGHAVAASPCGGCGDAPGTVVGTPGAVTAPGATTPGVPSTMPGTTTPNIPKEMPKQKDMPKDLPKDPAKTGGTDLPKTVTPPKTGTEVPKPIDVPKTGGGTDAPKPVDVPKAPGTISIPPLPVTPASGTNSPY